MKTKIIALAQNKVLIKTSVFALFMAIAIFAPLLKQQLITGSVVNAVLFLSTAYLGLSAGILISFIPSLFAFFIGLLPLVLLPMIPFIIAGNGLLVFCFWILKKKNFWLGAVSASVLKFLFLFSVSSYLFGFLIKKSLPSPIITMMAWPQLITALLGSALAFIILKIIKRHIYEI